MKMSFLSLPDWQRAARALLMVLLIGLSLAWLKRVQTHGDPRIFPTYLEGVLGQNAYQFGDSVSASINTGLAGLAGFDFVFHRLGFQRVWHKDLLGAYDVVREVMMSGDG